MFVIYPLLLNLEPLGTDLKAVHLIDGVLVRYYGIVRNETKPLGLDSVTIYVYLGRYYVAELIEGCVWICVRQVVGEVVDE